MAKNKKLSPRSKSALELLAALPPPKNSRVGAGVLRSQTRKRSPSKSRKGKAAPTLPSKAITSKTTAKPKKPVAPKKPATALQNAVAAGALPSAAAVIGTGQLQRHPGLWARFARYSRTPAFGKLFATGSLLILVVTTLLWTALSARLHEANADQLIDAYLFENIRTFQGAIFPGTHSFLIKWPLFAAMSLLGNSLGVFMAFTIVMVLATLGVLIYLLYRIERRPIAFGLLCLALASVLLSIPAQPYPGALLPVNMGMSTTRNLEYAVFLLVMYFAFSIKKINSAAYITALILMTLLIASDKLFAALAIGGGLLAAIWYAAWFRHRPAMRWTLQWLVVVIPAAALATGLLVALNYLNVTQIGEGEMASPYPFIRTTEQLILGLIFGVTALFTNFGANPVHEVLVVRELPGALLASLSQVSIVAYAVNGLVLLFGLFAVGSIIFHPRTYSVEPVADEKSRWMYLSLLLIGSTFTAAAVFVLTDHYYPVDSRYLTIALFAVFIAAATHYRTWKPRYRTVAAIAIILFAALPFGIMNTMSQYRASDIALSQKNTVTDRVSEELMRRNIVRLIGDYWDVTPVKGQSPGSLTVSPVDKCTLPRPVLNSTAWFKLPANTPSAYLAVKDVDTRPLDAPKRTATYNGCSLARVVGSYGVPSERVSIGQSATQEISEEPDILLLLYPDGIRPPKPAPSSMQHEAVQPKPLKIITPETKNFVPLTENDVCSRGTSLQVVAHQDDDILFMNPDVLRSIQDGRCIRTVYITAGDAGENIAYWGEREKGAKAAYAAMYGVPNIWRSDQQMLTGKKVTVEYLQDVPQLALVFLRLPDGNLGGEGFVGHENQSLRRAMSGAIPTITAVDKSATYTKPQLVGALLEIMIKDMPDEIRTQGSDNTFDGDHADHHDVGLLAREAASTYLQPHNLLRYIGYATRLMPVNLSDDEVTVKQNVFLAYAKFDGAVCQTAFECQNTHTYGSYLARQYLPVPVAVP